MNKMKSIVHRSLYRSCTVALDTNQSSQTEKPRWTSAMFGRGEKEKEKNGNVKIENSKISHQNGNVPLMSTFYPRSRVKYSNRKLKKSDTQYRSGSILLYPFLANEFWYASLLSAKGVQRV